MNLFLGLRRNKYRHVYGTTKEDEIYTGADISRSAWDTNKLTVNYKYVGFLTSSRRCNFSIFSVDDFREVDSIPIPRGHQGEVLDIDLSPFILNLCATSSNDCTIRLWNIGCDFDDNISIQSSKVFQGHKRKVGSVKFHPTAPDILVSSSIDKTVKIWDIENGISMYSIDTPDFVSSIDWNYG